MTPSRLAAALAAAALAATWLLPGAVAEPRAAAALRPLTLLPTAVLADPGPTLSGVVRLSASAEALDGRTIASVRFERSSSGKNNWETIATAKSPPFAVDFDTTAVADGHYDLRAVATDSDGNSAPSAPVEDRLVANVAPAATAADPGPILRGSVTLNADAEAHGGRTISSVEFQRAAAGTADWTTIAVATAPPYQATLDTLPLADGLYDLRVVATDSAGDSSSSARIRDRLVANVAPGATLDDPGALLHGNVLLFGSASASGGRTIVSVAFQWAVQGSGVWTTIRTDDSAPYSASFETTSVDNGFYDLRVVATDSSGAEAASAPAPYRLVANALPDVELEDPGPVLRGTVPLNAHAVAHGGASIASVEFQLSPAGADSWTSIGTARSEPYTIAFDTTKVADGLYDLRAVATDTDGNDAVSDPVTGRSIANVAPTVVLADPGETLTGIVRLDATATPAGGRTIASVEFQRAQAGTGEWVAIGTATTPPYSVDFDTTTVPDGLYDLRAVATDDQGTTGASAPLRDRRVANGSIGVTLEDPGQNLNGIVPLVADVSVPPGRSVTGVRFERSAAGRGEWQSIAVDEGEPYVVDFDTTLVADGRYDLRAVATADDGGETVSIPLTRRLVDNTPPRSTLADPGSPLHGKVTLSASAADSGSGVGSVTFQRSPAGAGDWATIATDTQPPYAVVFDTTRVPNGSYDLRTVASDVAGNQAPSVVVASRDVANDPNFGRPDANIVTSLAPAHDVRLLGSIADSPQHETWAVGFTSAPPAVVDGRQLPYTAPGDQLVLLRFTDDGGWEIADVLRAPDGSAFPLLPADKVQHTAIGVIGAMARSGEGWIWLMENPTDSGAEPVFGVFHRKPGSSFVFEAGATETLKPLLLSPQGGSLRLGVDADGRTYGLLLAPNQEPQAVPLPGSRVLTAGHRGAALPDGNVFYESLDYGVLDGQVWTKETAPLPPDYEPQKNDSIGLAAADANGPGTGWGTLLLTPATGKPKSLPLLLASFSGKDWTFGPSGLDVLDLAGDFAKAGGTVTPLGVRSDATGAWLHADVSLPDGGGDVVARYDTVAGRVTASWCTITGAEGACDSPLDLEHPASLPDATFTDHARVVALAVRRNFVAVYSDGDWASIAAPGFSPAFTPAFSSPRDGWLVGSSALGRWTTDDAASPLAPWPQPNRSPLTSVVLPPGSDGSLTSPGAIAVGFGGTALAYDPEQGWLTTPVPSRTKTLNLLGVAFAGPSSAFAVGQLGVILHWDGSSWSEDPQSISLTQSQLNAVAFGSDGKGYAVGAFGTILHYDGATWKLERPPDEDAETNITSVAVAGSDVFAVAGGNLITRTQQGWKRVDAAQLPDPPPPAGSLRVLAGLRDGGLVAAGVSVVLVRDRGGEAFSYAPQPIEGIAVAAAAFRVGGDVRALLSVALPAADPGTGNQGKDVAGFPPGDGELLRETDRGWQDVQGAQYPGGSGDLPGDGAMKTDPVLAAATTSDGSAGWVVGGYAGTITAAGQGTAAPLSGRPPGWWSSSIWRFDAAPPQPPGSGPTLPAQPGTVAFAFFTSPMCRVQCASTIGAQPNVNLDAAAKEIADYAAQPGGPAFAMLGGNARGPIDPAAWRAGNGAFDFPGLPALLTPLGDLPTLAAFGPLDPVPTLPDPIAPWAGAFATAPPPFGSGPSVPSITPAGPPGPPIDGVHRYYAFDAHQNGGTLRVIVLDNSAGTLEDSGPGQTEWLKARLAAAKAAGVPVVAVLALPLRGDGAQPGLARDAAAVATLLSQGGVSAVFTTNGPFQLNERYLVPEEPPPDVTQIPEYEGATVGYQQPQNNGVQWYFVSVATASTGADGVAPVDVQAIPLIESLELKPVDGLTVPRSSTLRFQAIASRLAGTLATTPGDDSFPGYDRYLGIPTPSCGSRPCVQPSYSFTSSDPTIANFVVPSGPGSRVPLLDGQGHTTGSSTSGLLCAYNSGQTTVTVSAGPFSASAKVTVGEGGFGPPCGTVFRPGVHGAVIVVKREQSSNQTSEGQTGGFGVAPPSAETPPVAANPVIPPVKLPPPPVAQPPPPPVVQQPPPPVPPPPPAPFKPPAQPPIPIVVVSPPPPPPPAAPPPPAPIPPPKVTPPPPPPQPAPPPPPPPQAPAPAPVPPVLPNPEPLAPPVGVPPTPFAGQPVPPSGSPVPVGGVAQSAAAAKKKEEAKKHAQQSAFAIRPAGASNDWWYAGAIGGVALAALVLAAIGFGRTLRPRPAPAWQDGASSRA